MVPLQDVEQMEQDNHGYDSTETLPELEKVPYHHRNRYLNFGNDENPAMPPSENTYPTIVITHKNENSSGNRRGSQVTEESLRRRASLPRPSWGEVPSYRSLVSVIIKDEPPKYEYVTGNKLNEEMVQPDAVGDTASGSINIRMFLYLYACMFTILFLVISCFCMYEGIETE